MNGFQRNIFQEIDGMSRRQERIIRKMMILSLAVHIVAFVMGSAISPLFPTMRVSPPVIVELTDAPISELPEEAPAPPPKAAPAFRAGSAGASLRARRSPPGPSRRRPPPPGGGSKNSTRASRRFPRPPSCERKERPAAFPCGTGPTRGPQGRGISPPPSHPEDRGTWGSTWRSWRAACAGRAAPR